MLINEYTKKISLTKIYYLSLVFILILGITAGITQAALTPSGTVIPSTASIEYEDGNQNQYSDVSNTVEVTVIQVAGVDLDTVTGATRTIQPDDTATYEVTITNTGNETDSYDLSFDGIPAGWSAEITNMTVNTLFDLDQEDDFEMNIAITAPEDAEDGDLASITLEAVSHFDGDVSDEFVMDTWITDTELEVIINAEKDGVPLEEGDDVVPGDEINYTIDVNNIGTGTATDIGITYQVPDYVTLDEDSIVVPDGFDYTYDEATGELTITGDEIDGGDSKQFTFDVTVDDYADPEDDIGGSVEVDFDDSNGDPHTLPPQEFPVFNIDEAPGVLVTIDGVLEETLTANDEVKVIFEVKNTGNVTDDFELLIADSYDPSIWTVYLDEAGNGVVDASDPEVNSGEFTGDIVPEGSLQYIAVGTVPGLEDGWESILNLTATSTQDGTISDQESFTLELSAPNMALTLDSDVTEQKPGEDIVYTLIAENEGREDADQVVISIPIPDHTDFKGGSIWVDGVQGTGKANYDEVENKIVTEAQTFASGEDMEIEFTVTIR